MSSKLVANKGRLTIGGVICNPDGTIKQQITLTSRVPERLRRLFSFLPCELQHDNAARNVMADAMTALFDIGSTNAAGSFKIYTAGGITLLSQILMANPAFADAVTGVAEGNTLPWTDLSAIGNGLAAEFVAMDRDETVLLTGHVAISDEELNFPFLEIAVEDIVKLLSCSYTAPP
jgi:hypothetical protein